MSITEDYVSFEVAKLLKEKGFGECSTSYISEDGDIFPTPFVKRKEHYPAPTQQMAMRWLREEHDIHIEITAYPHEDNKFHWCYMIKKMQNNVTLFGYYSIKNKAGFNTYEEAVEAALKYCLEHYL